ncbi:MAG: transporter, family, multidrug resistance protein [Chloroflexota bacterium]|nr:transporter, family, multidrug resistance protein [Chloroflexota bacterium]
MSLRPGNPLARIAAWTRRWDAILPLLAAELIVWLGFGALLPIMPIYFTQNGVDLGTLGVVVAAWPAARLVGEPIFGWVADRTRRVPLMVAGNVGAGIFLFLPLVWVGAGPFIVLRALAGLSTAIYDPAARGYISDATPADRRGEAFGLHGAAQMGGLLLGPAIGGLGSAAFGGVAFIFWFGAISSFAAAFAIAIRVRERPSAAGLAREGWSPAVDLTGFPHEPDHLVRRTTRDVDDADAGAAAGPASLRNRLLIAAILFTVGGNFAAGTYEVIWSLYLTGLGAGLELVGLTFAMFGLPVLILSPAFGRRVDRGGMTVYLVAGTALPVLAALVYTVIRDPLWSIPLILVEATGFAMFNPALYSIVAAGSPPGRSSTAQGVFGASGTLGFVIASLLAGNLAEIGIRLPFFVFAIVMTGFTIAAFVVGGSRLRHGAVRRLAGQPG